MEPADRAAREGALALARPDLGTLSVTGPDRLEWLQGVVTCDVSALAVGQGRWGLILSRQGKIASDVLIVAAADVLHLGIPRAQVERVRAWLQSFLVMEDADLEDASERFSWFSLHGPLAGTVAAGVASKVTGIVGAVDPSGLGGVVLVVPASLGGEVHAALEADPEATLGSEADWLRLRVERLVPLFGVDIDEQRNPHEASLDRRAVSWDKGCYLGQEAVCMLEMRGRVKRRLALLALSGTTAPAPSTPVLNAAGTEVVGETRSAASSAVWGAPVAMALLAESATPVGTCLSVGGVPARVVEPNR